MADYNPNQFLGPLPTARKEAASSTRQAASAMMEIFMGLKDAGFTDDQATSIVAKIVIELGRQ